MAPHLLSNGFLNMRRRHAKSLLMRKKQSPNHQWIIPNILSTQKKTAQRPENPLLLYHPRYLSPKTYGSPWQSFHPHPTLSLAPTPPTT
jgi:hypothetical protein